MKTTSISIRRATAGMLVCMSLLVTSQFSRAQTDPGGYEYLTVHGDGYTLFATRVHPAVVGQGIIDAAVGNVVSDDDINFSAALSPTRKYVVELEEPLQPKVIDVLSFSGNTLTLGEAVPSGAAYRLRPLWTLWELFSPAITPDLNPVENFDSETGDLFLLPDGNGGFRQYFYSSHPGHVGFFNAGTGAEENPHVRYTEALLVLRRGPAYDTVVSGSLKVTDTEIPLVTRFQPIGVVNPLGTLDNTGLSASLQAGTAVTADIVWAQDQFTGEYYRYFHSDGSGPGLTTGWRVVGAVGEAENQDAGSVWLSPGVIIQRRGPLPQTVVLNAPGGF